MTRRLRTLAGKSKPCLAGRATPSWTEVRGKNREKGSHGVRGGSSGAPGGWQLRWRLLPEVVAVIVVRATAAVRRAGMTPPVAGMVTARGRA